MTKKWHCQNSGNYCKYILKTVKLNKVEEWKKLANEKKKVADRIFSIINIVLCIILIPVIVLNVTVIISTYTHPDEIPGFFGVKPVAVLSGSMEDAIMTGILYL